MSEAQGRRRVTEEDPRYLRVRASLVSALFELAAEVPADEISVSQLASAAGVSRTTFYSHSSSPAQLLADTLVDRLAPIERLEHVERRTLQRAGIQRQAFTQGGDGHVVLLPQRQQRDVLRVGQAQFGQQRLVAARHRQRGGVERKAQLMVQQQLGGGLVGGRWHGAYCCCQLNCVQLN
mgnify:CR=1 FL=1